MSVYRSFLFAPGNHPRRVEKALSLDADVAILDLEDACPIAEKKATRAVVRPARSSASATNVSSCRTWRAYALERSIRSYRDS